MPRLGVLGWPVSHSRSPAVHNAALAAMGLAGWRYQLLPVPPALLACTMRALHASGFAGANVTIPHKQAALALAHDAGEAAREIGAANTLSLLADGTIVAENTDAPGLLEALGRSPQGMRALVLGAGGSARAAVWALLAAGASEVSVYNRTPERAVELARQLRARAVGAPEPADLLVNCTAVGLRSPSQRSQAPARAQRRAHSGDVAADELAQLGLSAQRLGDYGWVVDMVYGDSDTALLAAARAHGAQVVDGLEVLVAQAALSLELWTGTAAPREVMRAAARGRAGA
jgi:shikimate dehydrogenase